MNDTEQKLLTARALTATTGIIHEIQTLMLKNWGAVAFLPFGKGNWTAIPNVATKTVVYSITSKKKQPVDLAQYVAALDNSIHWLLGPDWATNIDLNGKALYRGKRVKKKKENGKPRAEDPGSGRPTE